MEGPADSLTIENKDRGEAETLGRAEEDAAQLKSPEEATPKTDSGPADEVCAVERAASGGPTATECLAADRPQPPGEECSVASGPQAVVTVGLPQASRATEPSYQRTPKTSIAEMDCLICFHRYSASRLPKLLACQHAFCAVCLKLILRNEDHTWLITCPLCRKSTVVFGGLVCSLCNKEDLLAQLDSPDPEAEVPCPPPPAGVSRAHRWSITGSQEPQSNRAAPKRLLLLLLVALLALVLPFLYTGLLKLVLCAVVVLGLILSSILCCDPGWKHCHFSWLPWRKKESHVVSVA